MNALNSSANAEATVVSSCAKRWPVFVVAFFLTFISFASADDKPNILFIAIDDLRPELGCYGSPAVKSPNLDAIAARGLRFDRAYCQQAICSPSRASLLTGTRPDTNGLTHNYIDFSEVDKALTTLPKHFADNGYETVTCGKIFHRQDHSPESWTRKPAHKLVKVPRPKNPYALAENQKLRNDNFKQFHDVRRRKEMQAQNILRSLCNARQLYDIQIRGIRGQHCTRFALRI